MIFRFLLIFTCLINSAFATEFGELVERYVKINQEKIKIIQANRHRIKGVEIIVADKAENLASRFGHGMLRLIDDDSTWVNDAVVSFSALSYEETYSLRRSIFGGYSITPQVMTMFEYWNMYTEDEERDLKRYVINLSDEKLNLFLNTLFKYLEDPTLLNDYTFLSNNCIGVITKIFVESGVTKSKRIKKIPSAIGPWIEKNELTLYPEFVIKNFKTLKQKTQALNILEMTNEELLKHFTLQELSYIYLNNNELSEEKVDFLANHLKNQQQDLNQTYSFNPIHQELYAGCESEACLKDFAAKEMKYLDSKDLLSTINYRQNSKRKYLKKYLTELSLK